MAAAGAPRAGGQADQLLEQGVALVPEEPAQLGRRGPVAPVDPFPPGGEDEAELGGVGQVEELPSQLGQLEQPALGLGEPAGVAQRAQQGRAPPGQGQPVRAVAAGAAAGEPLPDRAQAGRVEVAPAGEGQALVGQAQQELADVVGEAAERAGEQHEWASLPRCRTLRRSRSDSVRPRPALSGLLVRSASQLHRRRPPDQEDENQMEVKLGVTYSPKELVVETDQSPDDVTKLVEEAVAGKSRVLWLSDTRGRRVGVPTEKLAYIELGEEHPDKRVGFS